VFWDVGETTTKEFVLLKKIYFENQVSFLQKMLRWDIFEGVSMRFLCSVIKVENKIMINQKQYTNMDKRDDQVKLFL